MIPSKIFKSPALKKQSDHYPTSWRGKVPKKIKMAKTVTNDQEPFVFDNLLIAEKDHDYYVYINSLVLLVLF